MPTKANPSLDWGPVLTTTLMRYIDSGALHDNVFTSTYLLDWLMGKKRLRTLEGGERIRLGVMYAGSGNVKRYSGDEALDTTPSSGMTTAFFNWKQAAGTVTINGLEQRQNAGASQVRDLAKERITQTEMSITDVLATDAFSDGTADGSKQMTGLQAMIATDPTTGTYGDINSANNEAWRNQVETSVGSGAVNLLPALRSMFNRCTEGQGAKSAPDAIVTSQAIQEILESLINPAIRYAPKGSGEMSVLPMFRGAEVAWDEHGQSGVLYVLNSNHIFMFVHKDANLTMPSEGFIRPHGTDKLVAQILWQGNLGTNNRRKLGKLTGIT
jgi:hypothetical protein